MERFNDEILIDTYIKAILMKLEEPFIDQLANEMKRRQINIEDRLGLSYLKKEKNRMVNNSL